MYQDIVAHHGFDTIERLLLITETDTQTLGIRLGHCRQLQLFLAYARVWGVQPVVTIQPDQMISSSVDAAVVGVETVLHIGMVYSLQCAFIITECNMVPWQAAPFTIHGEIGKACGREVRAAIAIRTDLEKYAKKRLSAKPLGTSKR